MGKLTDFANWTDQKIKGVKDMLKPPSFKAALADSPSKMNAMAEEAKVYVVDWQVAIVAAAAKLAKADGIASKNEDAEMEEIFNMLEFEGENRTNAIELFKYAKNAPMPFYETILAIKDIVKPDQETAVILVMLLFRIAYADDQISEVTKECLTDACRLFDLSYDSCYQAYRNNRTYTDSVKEAYTILGCTTSDSDDVIKDRYSLLAKDFNPDRTTLKELAPDFTNFAEEKFKKIQAAYELVMQARTKTHT
jgi:DnaJ like chaperone protein